MNLYTFCTAYVLFLSMRKVIYILVAAQLFIWDVTIDAGNAW